MSQLSERDELTTDFLAYCRDDPVAYVMGAFPWEVKGTILENETGPRPWQLDLLQEIGERCRGRDVEALRLAKKAIRPIKVALVSGHACGKSTVMVWFLLWLFDTRPNFVGSVISNTKDQVGGKFFYELDVWHQLSAFKHLSEFRRGNSPKLIRVGSEKTWKLESWSTDASMAEAFAGQHSNAGTSVYLMDEASAIPDIFYKTAQGGMMDGEPFMFIAGNGTKNTGFLYDAFHSDAGNWITRQISSLDVLGHDHETILEMIEEMGGIDSEEAGIRILGLFARHGNTQFFSQDIIESCMNMPDVRGDVLAPLLMGVDPARMGEDMSVICMRKNRDCRTAFGDQTWVSYPKNDFTELANRISIMCHDAEMMNHPVHRIFVDSSGLGEGLIDMLRERSVPQVIPVYGAGTTSNPIASNKKAECYLELRKAMREGLVIPRDHERLRQDLSNISGYYGDNGKMKIQSKKDMKRMGFKSPDFVDALALTFAEPIFTKSLPYGLDSGYGPMYNRSLHKGGREDFRTWAKKRSRR